MELFSPKGGTSGVGGGGGTVFVQFPCSFWRRGGGASPFNKCLKMLVNMTCCW